MHTKATIASATKDIALNKLKPSPGNVRRTGTEVGLEEFATSIAAHGLLQPLVVEPERNGEGEETGWYLVTAGERRRKALRILAKQKRIKPSGLVLGADIVLRVPPVRQGPRRRQNLRPMSTLGREDLATRRPCRSRSTTSQRTLTPAMSASRAANDIVSDTICWPRHQNVWSSSGASMPCNLTSSPATTMVSPSMTLAGPVSESVRRLNVKMTTRRHDFRQGPARTTDARTTVRKYVYRAPATS